VRRLYEKDAGRSWVARVERGGDEAVLKWVDESAQPRCREELARERAFYHRFGGLRCVPSFLDDIDAPGHGAGIVLSHHPGVTLRQWLLDERSTPADPERIERCAGALGAALRELFEAPVSETPERADESRRLGRVFTVLMKSGPVQVSADADELARNSALHRLAAPLAHRALKRGLEAVPVRACIAHGDLHPNNVLVTPELQVYLLDFGRWEPGECVSDLGYLAATLATTLADRPAETSAFAAELDRTAEALGLSGERFASVVAVLRLGASVNSRLAPAGTRVSAAARLGLLPRLAGAAARASLGR
jgi:aminoglycoside phosphotransferase